MIDKLPQTSKQNNSLTHKFVSIVNLTLGLVSEKETKQQKDDKLNRPCTDDMMDKLFLEQNCHDTKTDTISPSSGLSHFGLRINPLDRPPVITTNRPLDGSRNSINLHLDFITQIGKQMSYILRHGANFEHVSNDPQGFMAISDLVNWFKSKLNIQITGNTIIDLVQSDRKSRFSIEHELVCALYGHSLELPSLNLPEYAELAYPNKRYVIHDTYANYLPAILNKGLSKMGRNNVHLTLYSGRTGIQRNKKPNIAIYINVPKAKRHGYKFRQCANDVILYLGDKDGFISPYFCHKIRDINTGAVILFDKSICPMFNANNESTLCEEK